jgi:heptosyltransferase-2
VLICPGPGEETAIALRDYGNCRVARGVGLGAYAVLLRDAALVIANDTGPGHMAAAVGAPLLSVLGPTDPARWGAIGPTVRFARGDAGGWPSLADVLARARAHGRMS